MATALNSFLAAGVLPIGDDDDKLRLLESAATALGSNLVKAPMQTYRLGLVALDDRTLPTDPVHERVGAVINEKWQTMTNKTGAAPTQVHRAVMLRAIEIAAEQVPPIRRAFALIVRNHGGVRDGDRARDAVGALLAEWSDSLADEVASVWVNPVDVSLPKLGSKPKKPAAGKDELLVGLAKAAGPADKDGRPIANANPHWPNAGQPWSNEFVGRATDAVSAAIQAAAKSFADETNDAVREALGQLTEGIQRMAVRDAKSELLWLGASMYSPSAKKPYNTLAGHALLLHAVLDVSRMVGAVAPASVDYFLYDLVNSVAPTRVRLLELLQGIGPELRALPEGKAIGTPDVWPASGRVSWLEYAVVQSAAERFEDQVGESDAYEDTQAALAVRLYRELQIRKLLRA